MRHFKPQVFLSFFFVKKKKTQKNRQSDNNTMSSCSSFSLISSQHRRSSRLTYISTRADKYHGYRCSYYRELSFPKPHLQEFVKQMNKSITEKTGSKLNWSSRGSHCDAHKHQSPSQQLQESVTVATITVTFAYCFILI